mgnify:FL=1
MFSKNNIEQNIVSSIDGATALKLDESYEIKNKEEQNALIDSFESEEENKIAEETNTPKISSQEIPSGVSIESASYMENNIAPASIEMNDEANNAINGSVEVEHTPKLFSEEENQENSEINVIKEDNVSDQLFDQEANEDEDFEIPAFLRRQKF